MPKKPKKTAFPAFLGTVVRGDGRGQALGFPTANVQLADPARRPPDGIYAGWAQLDGETSWRQAAIHVGPRPTFTGAAPSVEVHLLDYTGGTLYGQRLKVQCHYYMRRVTAFSTTGELQGAIAEDIALARAVLAQNRESGPAVS